MKSFKQLKSKLLKDKEVAATYKKLGKEFVLIVSTIEKQPQK